MPHHTFRSRTDALAAPPAAATSLPRLADFRSSLKVGLVSPSVLAGSFRAFEAILVAGTGLLLAGLYVEASDVAGQPLYAAIFAGMAILVVLLFEALDLYEPPALNAPLRRLPRLALGWGLAFAILFGAIFFLKAGPDLSRGWVALWFATGAVLLAAVRFLLSMLTRRWAREGRLNRRAVIYGSGPACAELIERLEAEQDNDIRICGIFDERADDRVTTAVRGYPHLGTADDLVAFGRNSRLDMVIMTLPLAAEARVIEIMKRVLVMPVDVRLAANATRVRFRPRTYSYVGNVPFIDLADKPIADWGTVAKWLFDKTVGILALILLAPVLIAVAIAVKTTSKGPVLFRQKRYGFNNELIEVFKFRSMYVDQADQAANKLVTRDDPRVTPVGRFIRKTSLDELPQLFNVVIGNLSLVGPRPHAVQAKAADRLYHDVVAEYFARHKVKPGITGWAQVNGWRGETDTEEKLRKRVEHDLYYIDNWSVFFDIYILVKTPLALLNSDSAY